MKKLSLILIPSILFAWFIATFFIDILAVPAVFQNVSSRDEAARLGVLIFKRFNFVELVFSIGLLVFFYFSDFKKMITVRVTAICAAFPIIYTILLTPKIVQYNEAKINAIDEAKLEIIQQSLDLYHGLYVKMDSVKLILLLIFFIEIVYRINKKNKITGEKI